MSEQFDSLVRKQLSDYAPEVPAHIWDQIERRKKKKRFAFWIWISENGNRLAFMAVLLATGLLLFQLSGKKQEMKRPANGAMEESVRSSFVEKSGALRESEEAVTAETAGKGTAAAINIQDIPENKSATVPSNMSESSVSLTSGLARKNHVTAAAFNTEISGGSSTTITGKGRKKNTRKTKEYNFAFDGTTEPEETPEPISADNEIKYAGDRMAADPEKQTFAFKMRRQPASWKPQPTGISTALVPCPEDRSAANKKYLEFYFSPDATIKSYKDTGNSAYLRARKESVSNVFSYSAGVRYTKVFNNAMSIRAGLNFSQIVEKMNTVEGNIIKVIYILDQNNDTIGNYSTRITLYRTTYNRYNTIDIPLTLGYEFGNGRLHGNLNAGVIANIYSWQKGKTLDDSFNSVSITTGGPASPYQFKSNIGLSFSGGFSLYYSLQGNTQLMMEPYFRYSLSAANKEEITLRQKFHTVGLRLGIRYDLNKLIEK